MNLKQLEVFIAVAESNSFSRGAESAFITQSTVSQHISSLEAELGIKLLDRTGKGAYLTEGGKLFLHHARRVLFETREAELAIRRFRGVEQVQLKIGGSSIPGDYMIPTLLPVLQQRYPGLAINLLQGDSLEILAKLQRGEIEVGIIGSSFDQSGVELIPVGRDEIRLVVNHLHHWAGRTSITLAELALEPLIIREDGSGTGKTIIESLATAGLSTADLKIAACLGSCESVKNAVLEGLGMAFLSLLSIRKELGRKELVEIDVQGMNISRQFYLACRSGRELSPAAKAFVSVLQELYA